MTSELLSHNETDIVSDSRSGNKANSFLPATSVCVVGLGYIGLPTASILASKGYQVAGVDVRDDVVETINRGEIHIEEPDLDVLVKAVVANNRLKAIREPQPADVFIICVPTPFTADRRPDLSYVEKAAQAIRPHVRKGNLIILESTSPPRTTEDVVARNAIPPELVVGKDVFVAHCPERVLPGRILIEAVENDRVVGMTPGCTRKAKSFYRTFVTGEVLATTAVAAELTKLVENSFRDVNIAFANELSILCDKFGVDTWEIIEMANRHPRVNILSPGPGVGGRCIRVEAWWLVDAAPELTHLMRTGGEGKESKPQAEPVVDQLQIVHVQDRQTDVAARASRLGDLALEDLLQDAPVHESGELIFGTDLQI